MVLARGTRALRGGDGHPGEGGPGTPARAPLTPPSRAPRSSAQTSRFEFFDRVLVQDPTGRGQALALPVRRGEPAALPRPPAPLRAAAALPYRAGPLLLPSVERDAPAVCVGVPHARRAGLLMVGCHARPWPAVSLASAASFAP